MNIFRLKGGDGSAEESRRGREPGEGGSEDGGVLLRLGARGGARVAVQVAPHAAATDASDDDSATAAAASVVLVVVDLRVIPGRWLGAAVQEGEGADGESCFGGREGLFVLGVVSHHIQVP